MKPKDMTRQRLEAEANRFEDALHRLRKAIGLIGFLLPTMLLIGVLFPSVTMQTSISHFFFTPMREVFVIALSGVGVFLIAYHGHAPEPGEWLTDFNVSTTAGVTALIVATVPTLCDVASCYVPLTLFDGWIGNETLQGALHFGAAGVFLSALATMCIWLFTKTDDPTPPEDKRRRNRLYRICGWIIFAMVALLFVFKMIFRPVGTAWDQAFNFTFWAEAVAVWAFGIAWLVKGEALKAAPTRFLYG